MFWKLIVIDVVAFVIVLCFCRFVLKLLQKCLSNQKFKLTAKFSYLITCVVILIFGIVLGKEFLYMIF